ncbi:hypothetical protein GEMRC1_000454 [Eukaryota sp. GEM-RC1]
MKVEPQLNRVSTLLIKSLQVAIEKVTRSAETAIQATNGFAYIEESLTSLLEETMLNSPIMNDLKSGKPVTSNRGSATNSLPPLQPCLTTNLLSSPI